MRQSVVTTIGVALLVLVFLFLVPGVPGAGERQAFSAPLQDAPILSSRLAGSIGKGSSRDSVTRLAPFVVKAFLPLSTDWLPADLPVEGGDRYCHHAYAGPHPAWECHHPDSVLSFSPHDAPAGLPESGIPAHAPGSRADSLTGILPFGSLFPVSPEIPPRRAFSL